MLMKKLLQGISFGVALGISTLAAAEPNPVSCPSVNAIQSASVLSVSDSSSDGYYTAYSMNNFGTPNTWVFGIALLKADSQADALQKAKTALPSLAGTPDPIYDPHHKIWICLYSINSGYVAAAATPIPASKSTINSAIKAAR